MVLFYFCPTPALYYVILIPAVIFSIMNKRALFVILAVIVVILFICIQYFGQSIEFFIKAYSLLMPRGFDMSWQTQLPTYFEYVIFISLALALGLLIFAYSFRKKEYDQWLLETFATTTMLVFFVYTILNIFAVGLLLYDVLKTNATALLIWEILFTWLPFFTLMFLLYYLLGFVMRRF